jgi:hypothetical protein
MCDRVPVEYRASKEPEIESLQREKAGGALPNDEEL